MRAKPVALAAVRSKVVGSLLLVLFVGVCVWSLFCCAVLNAVSKLQKSRWGRES